MNEIKFAFGELTTQTLQNITTYTLNLNFYATLLLVMFVLFLGTQITKRSKFLNTYDIPEPVTGGLIAAIFFFILSLLNINIIFQESIKEPLMLAFFTSVGLGADFASLKKGGKLLLSFGIVIVGFLIVQNGVGVGIMTLLGENPLIGLLAGSISLSGGHGTAAAWSETFSVAPYNFAMAKEIGIASATYGLIAGGLIGGPIAHYLIKKYNLKPKDGEVQDEGFVSPKKERLITAQSFIKSLGLVAFSMFIGTGIAYLTKNTAFKLPTFVWCLFAGIILRNSLSYLRLHKVFDREVGVIGNVSLSLFLAIAIMTLNLAQLSKLAVPMLALLAAQTVAIILYVRYITFNFCGRDYNAACMVAGHCGFGMGATPTAIANLQVVTNHFGPSQISFIIVPIMGGFFIDLLNAVVLKLYLFLPIFG